MSNLAQQVLARAASMPEGASLSAKALLHLEGRDLPVPRVMRTLDGATEVATPDGVLRLLTYLEGVPQHLTPRSPAQARSMARMAARLTKGLAGFSHPAANHVLQWDIRQASRKECSYPIDNHLQGVHQHR